MMTIVRAGMAAILTLAAIGVGVMLAWQGKPGMGLCSLVPMLLVARLVCPDK